MHVGRHRRPVVAVTVIVDVESSDAHRARNRPAMTRPRFDDMMVSFASRRVRL
jgi:hypothetical protein